MTDTILKACFLIWLIAAYAIRMPSLKRKRQIEVTDSRLTRLEALLSVLAFIGMQLIPLLQRNRVFSPKEPLYPVRSLPNEDRFRLRDA